MIWRATTIFGIGFCFGTFVTAQRAYELTTSSGDLQHEMLSSMAWSAFIGVALFVGVVIAELALLLRRLNRQHQASTVNKLSENGQ